MVRYEKIRCALCSGSGWIGKDCPICDTEGQIWAPVTRRKCNNCKGNGWVGSMCSRCEGRGYRTEVEPPLYTLSNWELKQASLKASAKMKEIESPRPILVHFSGNEPLRDRFKVVDMMKKLSGTIRICETYVDSESLAMFQEIPSVDSIYVLVGKGRGYVPPNSLITALKKERPEFEFKQNGSFHDRFILDEKQFILLGYGAQMAGLNKLSFAVSMPRNMIQDTYNSILEDFDNRWDDAASSAL